MAWSAHRLSYGPRPFQAVPHGEGLDVAGARRGEFEPAGSTTATRDLTAQLEGALGYRVCTPEGTVLGRLAWLRYRLPDGQIEALMIRPPSWRGLLSAREQGIASRRVETIGHRQRRIVVGLGRGAA